MCSEKQHGADQISQICLSDTCIEKLGKSIPLDGRANQQAISRQSINNLTKNKHMQIKNKLPTDRLQIIEQMNWMIPRKSVDE